MPEQDPRRAIVYNLFEQAIQEGKGVNFADIAKAAQYADAGVVWKIYKQLEKQHIPLPPVAKTARAAARRKRITDARSGEQPIPFKDLAEELGMGEAATRSLASKIGATETILTSEEAKVFREEVLRLWNEGLSQTEMTPFLQKMGYKATTGQLSGAFRVLREEGVISEEPAKVRRQKRREERFLQEILTDKDALQICDEMQITTRVFEELERRLRAKIQEKVGNDEKLQDIVAAKLEQIREIERAKARKQPYIQQETQEQVQESEPEKLESEEEQQQPEPHEEYVTPTDQEKIPTSNEEIQRLEKRKEQIRSHLQLLRQNGGIVITDGPVFVAGTNPMRQFEQLNNMSYDSLRFGLKGTLATKFSLPMYRLNKNAPPVTPPTAFSVIVNKGYHYNPDAPDPLGIQNLLWQNLELFVDKLLQSTGIDYTDEDKYRVLDEFFVSS